MIQRNFGLTERELKVLRLRLGLGLHGERVKTLKEIGLIFGVSGERIHQIEQKALNKLKHKERMGEI